MFTSRKIATMNGDSFRDEHSVYFDGNADSIHFNSNANTWNDTEGEWNTICCWIKIPYHTSTMRVWNIESANPGLLIVNAAGDSWDIGYNTAASDKIGYRSPKSDWSNKWRHVILSWEVNSVGSGTALDNTSGKMKPIMWVDGVNVNADYTDSHTTSNSCDTDDNDDLAIGSNSGHDGANNQPFFGHMSDLAGYKCQFTNKMAKTVYNGREPFDHNSWKTGQKYLTVWARMGDGNKDIEYPVYGSMNDIFPDDTSSPGTNDFGNCYGGFQGEEARSLFNFSSTSETSRSTAGTNITSEIKDSTDTETHAALGTSGATLDFTDHKPTASGGFIDNSFRIYSVTGATTGNKEIRNMSGASVSGNSVTIPSGEFSNSEEITAKYTFWSYDVVANSAFTANNAIAFMKTRSAGGQGCTIRNTTSAAGVLRAQGTVEAEKKYQFHIWFDDKDTHDIDSFIKITAGHSGADSTEYVNITLSASSSYQRFTEFTTAAGETDLFVSIGPSSTTEGHEVCLERLHIFKTETFLQVYDASYFNNGKSLDSNGNPKITGVSPF